MGRLTSCDLCSVINENFINASVVVSFKNTFISPIAAVPIAVQGNFVEISPQNQPGRMIICCYDIDTITLNSP